VKVEPADAALDAVWIEHGKMKFVVVVEPNIKTYLGNHLNAAKSL